ncbi:hypothetical protein [Lysobacter sp. HA18]
MVKPLGLVLFAVAVASSSSASAQDAWSDWVPINQATPMSPVVVSYKTKVNKDEIRVAWRCENLSSTAKSCSVGAGRSKVYNCFSGSSNVGTTSAPGESATVRPNDEYVFLGESACAGLGADSLNADVAISIED